ncbi:tetratricopeptide repeat protein [Streptomyces sp. R11]|uniref:Tetratricopeptide repeat protein n=1 Tax=Streptomyces sp. R11 TaxID=3238625 RepID=A0AB39NBB6_9ACTN
MCRETAPSGWLSSAPRWPRRSSVGRPRGCDRRRRRPDALGERHPYTRACAVNLANVLAELNELRQAEDLERMAVAGFQPTLGHEHPDTIVSRAKLGVTLRALGRIPESDQLQESTHAQFVRLLGENHPHTVSVREGKRIPRDPEPTAV